ncbi:MAG TPA: ABC transporter permease [Bryobacteraceae bacterium]|nr:ABC transporter permease [Bryobacteraceae bacterium]
MENFLKDLRHSLRMFRQNLGFTAAAVAALALGIGANTAIFSVVNTVLLKPPPFPDAERLVLFLNTSPQGSGQGASPIKFHHWRQQTAVVQDVTAFRSNVVNWTGGDSPEQLKAAQVSADYFRLFGATLIRGRGFSAEEDRPTGPHVVVISESFWQRRLATNPQVLGTPLFLGGDPHVIIGVVGDSFDFREFGPAPDVWVPFQLDPNPTIRDQGHYFTAAGRLKPGVSLKQAQTQLAASADAFRRTYPGTLQPNQSFSVDPMREALVRNVRSSLLVLVYAVSMVLLIACANVANLLLARAIGRRRELAIRAALGAARGRIIRQLLTESILLSTVGAVLGAAIGIAGIRALLLVNTANLPRVGREGALVTVDWRVLAFTALIAVITSVLFGLLPALQASRVDLSGTLKESSSRSGSGFRQNKARTLLVITELALAVVLVVGAALLIRTSLALAAVKPGFDASNVLTMRMSLTGQRFLKSAAIDRVIRDGVERIQALPGVEIASATCCVPLEGGYGLPFLVVGRPTEGNSPFHGGGGWQTVSTGYFDVFRIPIVKGRAFTDQDGAGGAPVVMINQAMAKRFWPKSDPLADRIWIGKGMMSELASEQPRQIIGVVSDVRDGGLNRDPQPVMYIPNAQVPDALNALNVRLTPLAWVVRTRGDSASLIPVIREQLRQASGLPVADIRTMDEVISRSISRQRFNMWLMSVFGGAALLLAAIGVYGLMAYSVQQRTQEIGIRIALGAESSHVQSMVILHGMRFALIGVVAGTAAAFGLARLIATLLFGVTAWDPLVFTAVPLLLLAVALLAVWIPALRATRVNPVTALRCD